MLASGLVAAPFFIILVIAGIVATFGFAFYQGKGNR
jgi:hypothetical protein